MNRTALSLALLCPLLVACAGPAETGIEDTTVIIEGDAPEIRGSWTTRPRQVDDNCPPNTLRDDDLAFLERPVTIGGYYPAGVRLEFQTTGEPIVLFGVYSENNGSLAVSGEVDLGSTGTVVVGIGGMAYFDPYTGTNGIVKWEGGYTAGLDPNGEGISCSVRGTWVANKSG